MRDEQLMASERVAVHELPTPLGFWHWSGKVYGQRSQDWLNISDPRSHDQLMEELDRTVAAKGGDVRAAVHDIAQRFTSTTAQFSVHERDQASDLSDSHCFLLAVTLTRLRVALLPYFLAYHCMRRAKTVRVGVCGYRRKAVLLTLSFAACRRGPYVLFDMYCLLFATCRTKRWSRLRRTA
mgnify:CR=1 FL=1